MSVEPEKQYRYFLYSAEQETLRKKIEDGVGKVFVPGEVLVNGKWKHFTQMSTSPDNVMFADSKIVAKGYIDEMQYTECTTRWKMEG